MKINLETGFDIFTNNPFEISNETVQDFYEIINSKKFTKSEKFKNINVLSEDDIKNYSYIKNLFKKVTRCLEVNKVNVEFINMWAMISNSNNYKENILPNIPHIDHNRKFKCMVYMNNVNKNSGAIHLIKCNPKKYENFRKQINSNTRKINDNIITNYEISEFKNCYGPMGTVIFFDTNTPHFAGPILEEKSNSRLVLRFNFRFTQNKIFNLF